MEGRRVLRLFPLAAPLLALPEDPGVERKPPRIHDLTQPAKSCNHDEIARPQGQDDARISASGSSAEGVPVEKTQSWCAARVAAM